MRSIRLFAGLSLVWGVSACALPESTSRASFVMDDETSDGSTSSTSEMTAGTSSATVGSAEGPSTAIVPMCGNGVVEGDEECDDGNFENDDTCLMNCTNAWCGDGFLLDGVESCDDGNGLDHDGCPTTCEFAYCGDGFVQLEVEECDDSNEDDEDGCDQSCVRTRRVFLTSKSYEGDIGGLLFADKECEIRATLGGLERPDRFKAWLSDSRESPATRFHHSPGRYELLDGTKVADSWDDLTDGSIAAPILINEFGELYDPITVLTNTRPDGTSGSAEFSCEDWTTGDFESEVWKGFSGHTNYEWTDSAVYNPSFCGISARLYCFEQ